MNMVYLSRTACCPSPPPRPPASCSTSASPGPRRRSSQAARRPTGTTQSLRAGGGVREVRGLGKRQWRRWACDWRRCWRRGRWWWRGWRRRAAGAAAATGRRGRWAGARGSRCTEVRLNRTTRWSWAAGNIRQFLKGRVHCKN